MKCIANVVIGSGMVWKGYLLFLIFSLALGLLSCKKSTDPPDLEAVNLSVDPSSITSSSVDLFWTQFHQSNFKVYEIHYSTVVNFSPSLTTYYDYNDELSDTTTFLTDLRPNTKYYFKIRVVTTDNRYSDSNEASAKTSPS